MSDFRKHIVGLDSRILVISDYHAPYQHPDAYEFLKAINNTYKPEIILNVGDEVDGHSISFHRSDSALPSADKELEYAIEEMRKLHELFPKMMICESNHGSLIFRRMKDQSIPLRHLIPLNELYETPLWSWHHEIMVETHLGQVLLVHGKTGAYNKLAMEQGVSCIQGHFHQKFEITWMQSTTGARFNMIVGCLVDPKSMAFAYGKNFSKIPCLGVGWINELGEPSLIRMILDKNGRWIKKL